MNIISFAVSVGSRITKPLFCMLAFFTFFIFGNRAQAMTFNIAYDVSINSLTNAAQVKAAFAVATQTIANEFTNAVTINLGVYWGATGPFIDDYIDLGESITDWQGYYTYAQLTNALLALRNTSDDSNAVASLPPSDPIATNKWFVPWAEGRALRLSGFPAISLDVDGYVAFAPGANFTFDPANRAAPGQYDFIGIAEHEITEVMGRTFDLNYDGGYIPYDLFRFTNNAQRSFNVNDRGVYFSVNKGLTAVKYFYTNVYYGDVQDWLPSSPADSFDAYATPGQVMELTPADFTALDILGFNGPRATLPIQTSLHQTNEVFQLSFTNNINATFFVLATTNVTQPLTNWTLLGMATQATLGHFQFNDLPTTTNSQRFYRLRSP